MYSLLDLYLILRRNCLRNYDARISLILSLNINIIKVIEDCFIIFNIIK